MSAQRFEPTFKKTSGELDPKFNKASSTGTKDYTKLINKPQINSVELEGNKTSDELYLQDKMREITPQDIDRILFGGE